MHLNTLFRLLQLQADGQMSWRLNMIRTFPRKSLPHGPPTRILLFDSAIRIPGSKCEKGGAPSICQVCLLGSHELWCEGFLWLEQKLIIIKGK